VRKGGKRGRGKREEGEARKGNRKELFMRVKVKSLKKKQNEGRRRRGGTVRKNA
jgi:hypothetical protein